MLTVQDINVCGISDDRLSDFADPAVQLFRKLDPEQKATYLSDLRARVSRKAPGAVPLAKVSETNS